MSVVKKYILQATICAFSALFCFENDHSSWAQETRKYRPVPTLTTFSVNTETYSILFDPGMDWIYQKLRRSPSGDWSTFFDVILGWKMDELKRTLVRQVTKQFEKIAEDEHLSADQLLVLLSAFVNQLRANAKPHQSQGSFYQPYELLVDGPGTVQEEAILLAGLMSQLCFDIQMVSIGSDWHVSVRGEGEFKDGVYEVDHRRLVFLSQPTSSTKKHRVKEGIARVVEIRERCESGIAYQPPIRRKPELDFDVPLANRVVQETKESSKFRRSGNAWVASISDSVEAVQSKDLFSHIGETRNRKAVLAGNQDDLLTLRMVNDPRR